MKHKNTLTLVSAIVALCATVTVHAESLSTTDGTTYDDITSKRADPDGLVINYTLPEGGIGMAKVKFSRLPADVQKQYGYDATKAKEYETQSAKASQDWCAEMDKLAKESLARKAEQETLANQQETIKTDRLIALAHLKEAEADLARATGGAVENSGGYYGGGDYAIAIPQTGRVAPARRQYAPVVTPVPLQPRFAPRAR